MHLSIQTGYLPGCIGRITELHAHYYHALVGFGLPFETRVAREFAAFCDRYDPLTDGLWLAIDGIHAASQGAHLRWLNEQIFEWHPLDLNRHKLAHLKN